MSQRTMYGPDITFLGVAACSHEAAPDDAGVVIVVRDRDGRVRPSAPLTACLGNRVVLEGLSAIAHAAVDAGRPPADLWDPWRPLLADREESGS